MSFISDHGIVEIGWHTTGEVPGFLCFRLRPIELFEGRDLIKLELGRKSEGTRRSKKENDEGS